MFYRIFNAGTRDFGDSEEAEKWLADRGFSVGRMQGKDPRGILYGDFDIQKWRNLSAEQRCFLDGWMVGDMRNGPVLVRALPMARAAAIEAFRRPDGIEPALKKEAE